MIPSSLNTPKSAVFGGQEGSGEAQIFKSNGFDPVAFAARNVERARLDKQRLDDERKAKTARVYGRLSKVTPSTEKGAEQIYRFSDELATTMAEMMAKGLDPEDMSTEAGRTLMKGEQKLRYLAAADKEAQDLFDAARKTYATQIDKYDPDTMDSFMDAFENAGTIEERLEVIKTKPMLSPYYNPEELVGQMKIVEPNRYVRKDQKNEFVTEFRYDEDRLGRAADVLIEKPENKPYVDKIQSQIDSGQIQSAKTVKEYLMNMRRTETPPLEETYRNDPQPRQGNTFVLNGNSLFSPTGWSATAYNEEGVLGVVLDRKGGDSQPKPPVNILNNSNEQVEATTDRIFFKDGKWFLQYSYPDPDKKTDTVVEEREMTSSDWATVGGETQFSASDLKGVINNAKELESTPKNRAKQQITEQDAEQFQQNYGTKKGPAKKSGTTLKVKPRDTSAINGE